MNVGNTVTLLVSEDDDSDTYYRLSASHTVTLSRIHGKKFGFVAFNVACDDNLVTMDSGLISFLNKFRYGRYTTKWNDIAERIQVVENSDTRCFPYEYNVTFYH